MGPTNYNEPLELVNPRKKETRAERSAREKLEEQNDSSRKIAIRRLTKALKESSLTTAQLEKMYEQFKEVK